MALKPANEVLRQKSKLVETQEEAEVIISHLESVLLLNKRFYAVCAPEVDVLKQVIVMRMNSVSLNIINPIIIGKKYPFISLKEHCFVHDKEVFNCLRYREITIKSGLDNKVGIVTGNVSIIIQHAIDHFNGFATIDKTIKLGLVRKDGQILEKDFCPCGSKKRFSACHMKI